MDTAPVIVGIDASETANAALKWAAEYAHRFDAPLVALIAWDPGSAAGFPVVEIDHGVEQRATEALDQTVRAVLGEDADVTKRVVRGKPTPVLLEASKSASLLVVGSRGHGAFTGMLLGSVSQHCVLQATCPVTVIRDQH